LSFLDELKEALTSIAGTSDQPIVVYSATWPIMREMGRTDAAAVDDILDALINVAGDRTLLLPTFSRGYQDGRCDLDNAPSTTGMLTEVFRKRPGGVRTLSAFFSFKVTGPDEGLLGEMLPVDAWGDGSLYEWMETRNARHILLGAHPTHSSYLHRLEWLVRDIIPYRYDKSFAGVLVRGGVERQVTERLYVRSLEPEAKNDFTVLTDTLDEAGMARLPLRGVSLAAFDTVPARDAILLRLRKDPLTVLANREDFS